MTWAGGIQLRRLDYQFRVDDVANRQLNPCPFNDPYSIVLGNVDTLDCTIETGRFSFVSAADEDSTRQDVWAVFGELSLPVTDTLDIQAALRYESYDGETGSSLDPKLALSWRPIGWLTLRGSASTTFAGPQLAWLIGTDTQLHFINIGPGPSIAMAVDVKGNPELEPETALATNLGVIVQTERFYSSIDWWRLDVDDPFYTASGNQIMDAYRANDCADGGAGVGTPECDILRTHVIPEGTQPRGTERIVVNRVNGTSELTEGIDASALYNFFNVAGGLLSLGLDATYTYKYESGDFVEINGLTLAPGGDFAGYLNDGIPFTPKPKLKGQAYARYSRNNHFLGLTMRYIDSYEDERPSVPELARIDEMITLDLTYNVQLFDKLDLSLSVFNLTDEDPPMTSTDHNYDPMTHSGFGRMIKLGAVYRFDL
jgi:iron complex outermembrane receptor protein